MVLHRDLWIAVCKGVLHRGMGETGMMARRWRVQYTGRDMFGIAYSAVSHIVDQVKGRVKTDYDFQRGYWLLNSQI